MTDKLEYEEMIYAILKKYGLYNRRDEYIDVCYIGYAKALNTFDEKKGELKWHIYRCMKNELLSELRKESRKKRQGVTVSFDENTSDETTTLDDKTINGYETDKLYECLFQLPVYEQYVVYETFFNGKSQEEIAQRLEMKQASVSKIKKNGLDRIKAKYEKNFK